MPTGADAARALARVHAIKGRRPRVRRAGELDWKEVDVGAPLYGNDQIDSRGQTAIEYADGRTDAFKEGSLARVLPPERKAKRKPRPITSGEASFAKER